MGDVIIGDEWNNYLLGGTGDDTLNGGAGRDTMEGGAGNDVYIVGNPRDVIIEGVDQGHDTVRSSRDYTLGANLEDLVLTGSVMYTHGVGNELDNRITGNEAYNDLSGGAGNDTLNGGAGPDSLSGGAGDDIYIVDDANEVVFENPGEGRDTIRASVDWWWLAPDVENVVLTGDTAIVAMGNELDNVLIGNANGNQLYGGDGNDTLNGGLGADTLSGGEGDDLYVIDDEGDAIEFYADEGHDIVRSSISWSLGSYSFLEDLVLVGNEHLGASGNEAANKIVGNSGDNTMNGFGGDDSLVGGLGNDYLDGGTGIDTMRGGGGDDVYVVNDIGDTVIEAADGGAIDIVWAGIDYTLPANVEQMFTFGGTHFVGNSLDNYITGGNGVSIDGRAGDDVLWSHSEIADTLIGGTGDDYFIFSYRNGVVVEAAGGGEDTIEAWQDIDLASFANVENLVLAGGTGTTATGNAFANKIDGNMTANTLYGLDGNDRLDGDFLDGSGAIGDDRVFGGDGDDWIEGSRGSDLLDGGAGDDTIRGGWGNDELIGGEGRDTFELVELGGLDRLTDFQGGANGESLNLADILISNDGYDVASNVDDFIRFTDTAEGTIIQVDADGKYFDTGFVDAVLLQGVSLGNVGQAIADGTLVLQKSETAFG